MWILDHFSISLIIIVIIIIIIIIMILGDLLAFLIQSSADF